MTTAEQLYAPMTYIVQFFINSPQAVPVETCEGLTIYFPSLL